MTTRDTLQKQYRSRQENPVTDQVQQALDLIDYRLNELETQGHEQTAVSQPRRGPGEIVGTILATVNLLSATAVLWLLVLGLMDTRTGTVAFAIFVLMAITGGVMAAKTEKAKTT